MRRLRALSFSIALLGIAPSARAEVQVTFTNPESYADAALHRDRGPNGREVALTMVREELMRLGKRYLAPNQTLKVEVLDIDLAGELEWWHGPYDIRYLRDYTWPRIKLHYTLEQDGRPIRSAEETVSDMSYQMSVTAVTRSGESMPYEKLMLARWFRSRFATVD
jgi:hypothetical protein